MLCGVSSEDAPQHTSEKGQLTVIKKLHLAVRLNPQKEPNEILSHDYPAYLYFTVCLRIGNADHME